ncbi:MAG: aminotransferase class I/II-fold pyridoxal phosphate-dependent enzyme [Bacteroidia bacterium]|nr:aminotransferase class I/II-fold pyridoxal phosphate-dependent enzyme [Bacteroidia bacterium]
MISQLLCNKNNTLIEAWRLINENAKGTVFIVDDEKILLGILTDGIIRRFLLSGGSLNECVENIMEINCVFGNVAETYQQLLSKITDSIKIIPLVNDNNKIEDYFLLKSEIKTPIAFPNLNGNELNYLIDAFLSTWISSTGSYINRFEENFSTFCDSKFGIAVSNGTVALHLALITLGIGKDDEVIVPDLTFAATINTVLHANATPVIVDIEKDTWCIDPIEIEKAITPKTKAIIPVHLYGQPCDMNAIMGIASKYNLFVIEDCAEAHGAEFEGKKVGSFGDIACFSFYGNKVITTGEGGMCLTNKSELNDKMRVLRDHGMSNLQAAIGVAQLERIEKILLDRHALENKFRERFKNILNISFQKDDFTNRKKITWLICALIKKNKQKIMDALIKKGIDIRPFFFPLSQMEIYKKFVFSNKNSLDISYKGINFPTNSSVSENVLNEIFNICKQYD